MDAKMIQNYHFDITVGPLFMGTIVKVHILPHQGMYLWLVTVMVHD